MMKVAARAALGGSSSSRKKTAATAAAARLAVQKLAEFCANPTNAEEPQCVELRLRNEQRAAQHAAFQAALEKERVFCAANPYDIGCLVRDFFPVLLLLIVILVVWCCCNNDDEDKYD